MKPHTTPPSPPEPETPGPPADGRPAGLYALRQPPVGPCVSTRPAHAGPGGAIAVHRDHIATGGQDGAVRLWTRAGPSLGAWRGERPVVAVGFSGVNRILALDEAGALLVLSSELVLLDRLDLGVAHRGLVTWPDRAGAVLACHQRGLWRWHPDRGHTSVDTARANSAVGLPDGSVAWSDGDTVTWMGPEEERRASYLLGKPAAHFPPDISVIAATAPSCVLVSTRVDGDLYSSTEMSILDLSTGQCAAVPGAPNSEVWSVAHGRPLVFGAGQSTPDLGWIPATFGLPNAVAGVPGDEDRVVSVGQDGALREWAFSPAPAEDVGAFAGHPGAVPGEVATWHAETRTLRRWSTERGAMIAELSRSLDGPALPILVAGAPGEDRLRQLGPMQARQSDERTGAEGITTFNRQGSRVCSHPGGLGPRVSSDGRFAAWITTQGWIAGFDPHSATRSLLRTPHRRRGVVVRVGDGWVVGDVSGTVTGWRAQGVEWQTETEGVVAMVEVPAGVAVLLGSEGRGTTFALLDPHTGALSARRPLPTGVYIDSLVSHGDRVATQSAPIVTWDLGSVATVVPGTEGLWTARVDPSLRYALFIDHERRVSVRTLGQSTTRDTGLVASLVHHTCMTPLVAAFATKDGDVACVDGQGELKRIYPVGARALALTLEGTRLLGAFEDGSVRWWDLTTGHEGALPGFRRAVWWLGMVGAERALAWGLDPFEGFRRYDLASGLVEQEGPVGFVVGELGAGRLYLAGLHERVVVDLDATTPPPDGVRIGTSSHIDVTPEGDVILSGTAGVELVSPTGARRASGPPSPRSGVVAAAGRLTYVVGDPPALVVAEAGSSRTCPLPPHARSAFSPDGQMLATAGAEVSVVTVQDGQLVASYPIKTVNCLAWHGAALAAGTTTGELWVIEGLPGVGAARSLQVGDEGIRELFFATPNRVFVIDEAGRLTVVGVSGGAEGEHTRP